MNTHIEMPIRMRSLPRWQSRPVPWFVAWFEGVPDFRIIQSGRIAQAVREKLCWVCGEPLGKYKTFVIGPMCAVNRVVSEPPSHHDRAAYSASMCPFLA